MPDLVIQALRDHQRRQAVERASAGKRWVEGGFVFTTQAGTPLDGVNVTKRLKKVLAAAGLPDMRWPDLRHSCASLLLAEKIPPRVVMDTLGHSQISQTMRYSHVIAELKNEAAQSMDRVLSGP